jgi:hypothetical protein
MNVRDMKKGRRVRFTMNGLGAVDLDNLTHFVRDNIYGCDDVGILSFKHPNQKEAPNGCKGWWYVAVDSKDGDRRTLYVAVSPRMVEEDVPMAAFKVTIRVRFEADATAEHVRAVLARELAGTFIRSSDDVLSVEKK